MRLSKPGSFGAVGRLLPKQYRRFLLGRAAEIAGMTRWEFEALLADRGIVRVIESDAVEVLEAQSQRLRHAE